MSDDFFFFRKRGIERGQDRFDVVKKARRISQTLDRYVLARRGELPATRTVVWKRVLLAFLGVLIVTTALYGIVVGIMSFFRWI